MALPRHEAAAHDADTLKDPKGPDETKDDAGEPHPSGAWWRTVSIDSETPPGRSPSTIANVVHRGDPQRVSSRGIRDDPNHLLLLMVRPKVGDGLGLVDGFAETVGIGLNVIILRTQGMHEVIWTRCSTRAMALSNLRRYL